MYRSPTRRARPPQSHWYVSGSLLLQASMGCCLQWEALLCSSGSSQVMRMSPEALGCDKLRHKSPCAAFTKDHPFKSSFTTAAMCVWVWR